MDSIIQFLWTGRGGGQWIETAPEVSSSSIRKKVFFRLNHGSNTLEKKFQVLRCKCYYNVEEILIADVFVHVSGSWEGRTTTWQHSCSFLFYQCLMIPKEISSVSFPLSDVARTKIRTSSSVAWFSYIGKVCAISEILSEWGWWLNARAKSRLTRMQCHQNGPDSMNTMSHPTKKKKTKKINKWPSRKSFL